MLVSCLGSQRYLRQFHDVSGVPHVRIRETSTRPDVGYSAAGYRALGGACASAPCPVSRISGCYGG
ncbi:hypothetical protein CHELA41_20480 [Hyphomicrobiales bacterium]|nr:hypothetical protein CHELA41_20480 [Hyphomicrobiales bacterium]